MNEGAPTYEGITPEQAVEGIKPTKFRRNDDGTFVVYINGSMPCHITPDFPPQTQHMLSEHCTWLKLRKLYMEHPERFEHAPTPQPQRRPESTNSEKIMDAYNEINRLNAEVIAGIDVDENKQKIADLAMYIEYLRDNME